MREISKQELRKATRGGFDAFRPVVIAHGPSIHRLAQCVCPDTEQILPTTLDHLLAIRDRLPLFRHDRPFGHWLVRQFLDLFAVGCEASRRALGEDQTMDTRRNRVSDVVLATLEHLPRNHRDALLLRLGLEWPVEDVAEALGVAPKRLETMLWRGRWILVNHLRHFYVRSSGRDVPSYASADLEGDCRDFRLQLRRAQSSDPADDLKLEDLAHANDCPTCRVELEVYRKVKLRHANLSTLSPELIWDYLLRHRGAHLSEEIMDLDREGAIELMHELGVRPPTFWPLLFVFFFAIGLGAWLLWGMP